MFDPDHSPKHIIMLMLDAFRPDYLTIYEPPNLQRLVREGTWVAEARSVFPSTTTANQTSFVTGSLPAATGIPNNARYDRQSDTVVARLRDNRCPTIAEILREHGWTAASVRHFMLENRGVDEYLQGDIDAFIGLFESDPPGLAVLYHPDTDAVGHRFGPFSPEMRHAVLAVDAKIGQLLSTLERKGLAERTVIVVASDHGMIPNDGKPLLSSLLAVVEELDLKVAFDESQIQEETELVGLQFGATFLYWRPGMWREEREAQVVAALSRIDGLAVLRSDDVRSLGADPELVGDLVLAPHEGWQIHAGSGTGGMHGLGAANHSTMLFWGQGVRRGHVVHRASITDIVPTLLAMVGIPAPTSVSGSVLQGVMAAMEAASVTANTAAMQEVAAVAEQESATQQLAVETSPEGVMSFTLDCGSEQRIKSFRVVSDGGDDPVGPKAFTLQVSRDGVSFDEVISGELPPLAGGEGEWLKVEQPTSARYVRLVAHSGYGQTARIAGLTVADGEW